MYNDNDLSATELMDMEQEQEQDLYGTQDIDKMVKTKKYKKSFEEWAEEQEKFYERRADEDMDDGMDLEFM